MLDLAVFGMEAIRPKWAPDVTWVIDLPVFGMEAIRPKSGTGCNMGDRLGSFWVGSYSAEIGHRM